MRYLFVIWVLGVLAAVSDNVLADSAVEQAISRIEDEEMRVMKIELAAAKRDCERSARCFQYKLLLGMMKRRLQEIEERQSTATPEPLSPEVREAKEW